MENPNQLLMLPGPTDYDPRVLAEMSKPMVAHYGVEWTEFYDETRDMIKKVMGTKNDLFLYVGSGHSAIEAVVGSLIEPGDDILVLSNGYYGERNAEICETYGAKVSKFEAEWGETFDQDKLDAYLEENHQKFKAVIVPHTETSTGITNPVKELTKIIKKYNLLTYVDAVCSAGVTELKMDDWNIDLCITASQKGLGAPPGLAVVAVSDKAWEAIKNRDAAPTGWYLNLLTMKKFHDTQREWQPYGITMAVNVVRALHKSLEIAKEEGFNERIKRHKNMAKYFRDSLREIDLEILSDENYASNAVTVIKNPPGYNSEELISKLKEEYNIRIANGLGVYADKAVRVGHMNIRASKNSIVPLVNAFKEIMA